MSLKVCEVELTAPPAAVWGLERYEALRVLVRYAGRPVGWVGVPTHGRAMIPAAELRATIEREVGWSLLPLVLAPPPPAPPRAASPVSVVICTRDRADQLAGCLDAVLALEHPAYEVIVVDNAPSDDATARIAAARPVRYVREPLPGLDRARNRGILEARHPIVAFVDDDARPDRGWLRALDAAFADPAVMAVTGLIAPAELETRAQRLFELVYGGMTQGLRPWRVRRRELGRWALLWSSAFGAGANMAFRREVFDDVGLFDPALDVGTPSGGGGDLELLHRVVAAGHTLLYEPAAIMWHVHRRDEGALRRQLFDNGRGFACHLLTCARRGTVPPRVVLDFALRAWGWGWLVRRLVRPRGLPRRHVAAELAGALLGPWYYVRSRRHARRLDAPRDSTAAAPAPAPIAEAATEAAPEAAPDAAPIATTPHARLP